MLISVGKSINDTLEDMLWADDINTKNSTLKDKIDAWYKET